MLCDETSVSLCCAKEKLSFDLTWDRPYALRSLLTEAKTIPWQFCQNTRAYSTALSNASVKATCVARVLGLLAFTRSITMQESIYHYMGDMLPAKRREQAFLSLYIHGRDYSTQSPVRSEKSRSLSPTVLADLASVLHRVNQFMQTFQSLRE